MIRILYADGSRRDRDLVRPFLGAAAEGFHVTEVRTLSELCESVQARDCDLVLGDFDLSGCLGLELVHAVRARRPGLPIVILTADKDRAREAVELGVIDCLRKTPDELNRLPQIVRAVIERTRLELEKPRVEERLRRVTRARKAMADCYRVQARASEEVQLLQDSCRILVESGGYRSAWVGMVRNDEDKTIEPVASAGDDAGHLASIRISWAENSPGQGGVGMAVRSRTAQATRHIQVDPNFSTHFKDVIAPGYRAAAALPLICDNEVAGVIGILAAEPEAFDADELASLDELARDIAYSMSNLRLRATQRRAERVLQLEHTVTRCLAEASSVGDAMKTVIRAVCEPQGWDCGRYFRLDDLAGVLRFEEAWGVPGAGIEEFIERSRAIAVRRGVGLAGHVWESGEPLWIADIRNDDRVLGTAHASESGIRGAFLFPVKSEGKTHGVLAFSSREIREPDERLLQAVIVIGSQIGQFVHRKQAEAVLRESEARFRSLSALSSDWYWETDRDRRYITREGKGLFDQESVLGKRREELPGFVCGAAEWEAHLRTLAEHRPFRDFMYQRRDAGGTLSYISISGEPVFDAHGEFQGYRGTGRELTEIMRGREELRRFRAAMDTSSDMIMLVDRATMRFIDVNATACEMQGHTRDEMLRLGPQDVSGTSREALERVYDEMIASGQTTYEKSEHRRKDGTCVPIEIFHRAVRTEQGWIIVSILRDVAERARAEQLQNLEHSIARCLAEADSAPVALQSVMRAICESEGWECGRYIRVDEAAGVMRFSEHWCGPDPTVEQFIAGKREAVYGPGEGLAGRVWQSGQPLWSADTTTDERGFGSAVNLATGMRGAFVFPVVTEGKTIGVFTFNSREVRDPDERLLRAVRAIGSQIGQFMQRKQAEEGVRESEERFRSLTTLSSDWYWEQDAEYRFVDMTSEIDRMTGVSALSHIGKRRWEIAAPNMTEADWAAHRAVVEAHQPFHDLELCRRAEDGSLHWVSISGEPISDTEGRFKGYRGIGKDITARKREEKLLALEHAVTRSLAESESASAAMTAVIRAMCETEGWECGRYLRVDEPAGVLRCSESWHAPDETIAKFIAIKRDTVIGRGVGLAGNAWQSGQPTWFADVQDEPRALPTALGREPGMHGAFHFPVSSEGKTIGVLAFNSRKIREPDERLLRAVHAIGIQIGQFLQRKETDEKVSSQALQQRLIAEFSQQALASAELAEVLEGAARLVADTLKVAYSNVLQLHPDGKQLTYKAAIGWPQEWVAHRVVPIGPGSRLEYILNRGEPLIIEDYIAESEFAPTPLRAYGIRSGVQVPILGTRVAYGVLSVHTPEPRRFTDEEVSFLRSVANILAIAIQRKNAEDKLAHLAQFDTVTALPNRHLLRDRLGQALTHAQRNHWLGGVLFVDLDRFKAVNDTFGHGVGDKLLRAVAARLGGCVRSGDTVGRLSGDEFAVVLSNLAKGDDAGLVAQKIVTALAAPFDLDGHQTYISASVGMALYPGDGTESDALLKNADTAMYRAKEQGRNCYRFFLPQMNDRLMERMQLEGKLRGALERGEFRLHYQPKVRLDTGVISGFEALLRWKQDDRLVAPAEFIPILEDTGLIVPVGEWVLRSVCEQLKQWQDRGIAPRPIAVNLSGRQFQQQYLVTMVEQILRETGVAPDLLEFELTETLLMSDAEEAVQMLRELKGLGVRLSVDDFGTGYSSLAYLRRFPLDTLKIDRSFVRDAVSNPDDATLTLTIINLAHSMRLRVVAEGVETQGQLNFLRTHGCDEMQGYYFERPLDAEACTEALIEDRRLQNPELQRAVGVPTLLLVDDSEDDLTLLGRALACDDYHIITAKGATAGFEMLARHGADIVVSDFRMPEMNGVEFLANVRKLYPDAVRVVATTGDDMPTLTSVINNAGIHKFLSKYWDPDRLRAEVRAAFEQERRRPPAEGATAAIPLPTISIV